MAKKKSRFEEGIENFAEEMESLGKRLEAKADRKRKDHCHHNTLGILGPLISSLLGIIVISLFVWILGIVNAGIGSEFISNLRAFFLLNLNLFFAISVFFSFSKYFSRRNPKEYELFSPISLGVGVAFALWITGNIMALSNLSAYAPVLGTVSAFLVNSSYWFFGLFLFIGYLILVIRILTEGLETKERAEMKSMKNDKIKRLYRSGKDRILGGVCGGIAEYLEVDPVLIRLIWIAGTFAFGSGILLYIIAWIIIPRNPKHKWD